MPKIYKHQKNTVFESKGYHTKFSVQVNQDKYIYLMKVNDNNIKREFIKLVQDIISVWGKM